MWKKCPYKGDKLKQHWNKEAQGRAKPSEIREGNIKDSFEIKIDRYWGA